MQIRSAADPVWKGPTGRSLLPKRPWQRTTTLQPKNRPPSAQSLAQQARTLAERRRQLRRQQQEQEEQVAQLKDQLFRTRRRLETLDDSVRRLSQSQLDTVEGLLRQAEGLIAEGKLDLAALIAARAESIVEEAHQRAELSQTVEQALLTAGRGLEGVQVFTTSRGVVFRLSGDLFPLGRADLNPSANPQNRRVGSSDPAPTPTGSRSL
ncbi:MAG: hypothetical protein KatS3mg115_2141 [Candidatus Poribacteria bacterium]|nr:MAG: hypothetical protein KatS3mg115_2141 [Candidatus Poribacteria bacterium]